MAMTMKSLFEELQDVKAGIASHKHTNAEGEDWRCTSPYCPRGNNVQDEPVAGPGDNPEIVKGYRRTYA